MVFKPTRYLSTGFIAFITAVLLFLVCIVAYALNPQSSKSSDKNQDITLEILKKLDQKHFVDLNVDDSLSERFLDNYLDRLDPNKAFFYQSDIDEFKQYRFSLDNYLKDGDNSIGFVIYSKFRERLEQRLNQVIKMLKDNSFKFDFDKNESIANDTENLNWLASESAADEYWRKRIKSFLLSQKLADESVDKSREQLVKRYANQLARVKKNTDDDVYEIYINAFAELYDPHTSYLAPRTSENFNINMSLSLEGIGAVLQTEDEYTKVVRLVNGGPAFKQGELQPADRITGVAQGINGEMTDVIGWRLDEVVSLIRGPKDSIVRLQIDSSTPSDKGTKTIQIKRDKVKLEDQAAQKAVFTVSNDGEPYKVGVINIPGFYIDFQAYRERDPNYRSTTRDVLRLLNELEAENVDGIVLDLRNNGGGSLQEATTLTDLFIDKGPVVQIGKGTLNSTQRSRYNAVYRGPLVVMINRLSASASEIFAGAIQDYKRGLIVGSQSFGKGTVQSLTPLDSRGDLKITESKFYRVSGESTQHRGVIPDISFPELLDKEKIGESSYDTALEWSKTRAVSYPQYLPINTILSPLTERHTNRIAEDPDFIYINEQKSLLDRYTGKDFISLNENVRLQEKKELEKATLALENKRRKAKGLKKFKQYEDLKEFNEEKNKRTAATAGTTVIDTEDDAMLREAGYILKDFTELLSKGSSSKVAKK
ncbi:MAG: carboxy terminal-processing peptidase [Cellvibrionaceae bacterium]